MVVGIVLCASLFTIADYIYFFFFFVTCICFLYIYVCDYGFSLCILGSCVVRLDF